MSRFTPERLQAILETSDPVPVWAIETGTWLGDTAMILSEALDIVHTAEISESLYEKACNRLYDYTNVVCHLGDSRAVLDELLCEMEGPGLVYCDAHWWPAQQGGPIDGGGQGDFPLWGELDIVRHCHKTRVVVVDDIHCFGGASGDLEQGWQGVSETTVLAALEGRVEGHAVVGDALVIWLNSERV